MSGTRERNLLSLVRHELTLPPCSATLEKSNDSLPRRVSGHFSSPLTLDGNAHTTSHESRTTHYSFSFCFTGLSYFLSGCKVSEDARLPQGSRKIFLCFSPKVLYHYYCYCVVRVPPSRGTNYLPCYCPYALDPGDE